MSLRSIILGLLLGAFISGVTYYNDFVLRQPSLINHLLPVSVLGTLIILTLLVNPLLGARGMIRRFKRGELAMIVAMGLAACTWPGAGFFRTAVTNLAMPAYFYKTDAAWQSQQVMAYLPGGSARLAPGHIRDWQLLLDRLAKGESGEPGLAHQLWQVMPPEDQLALQRILDNRSLNTERRHVLLGLLNRAMGGGRLGGVPTAQQMRGEELRELNHRLLAEAWPETLSPPPRGWPMLPTRGDETDDAFLDALIAPAPDRSIGLSDLPWTRWGPVLGLWGGLALTLGLASLCLALIVHPQWSRRELLSYPIPRFVSEMTRRDRGHEVEEGPVRPALRCFDGQVGKRNSDIDRCQRGKVRLLTGDLPDLIESIHRNVEEDLAVQVFWEGDRPGDRVLISRGQQAALRKFGPRRWQRGSTS